MLPIHLPAGPLRAAYDAVDWAPTSLGPVEAWAGELRSAVDLMLDTRFPVTLFWGPALTLVYNDAYTELIGQKHPSALGRDTQEVFPEAWHIIGPMLRSVAETGDPTWVRDEYVPLERHGFLEECYFTFSYSPVRDAEGGVAGVMDIATETTGEVLLRRRAELLLALRDALAHVTELEQVPRLALPLLRASDRDIVAADIHLDTSRARPGVPPAEEQVESIGGRRVAHLPLGAGASDASRLVVELSPQLAPDESYLGFLRLVAAALGQALDRVRISSAERRTARAQRAMSEAFQRSLLPEPTRVGRPEVAVRYQPAAELAQVGGDWYDLVELEDGSLAVVVGDVAGHDQESAVGMAQVRNLLRGIAYTRHPDPPSRVLQELDRAMGGMAADLMATGVLAHISAAGDALRLRWSNAGHPPPVLVSPDGRARLLETIPDLLLGLDRDAPRVDHDVDLPPGSTVVLYTDGLVERRSAPLSEGLDWLVESLADCQDLGVGALCDHLLKTVATVEDDVALLVLRS